VFNEISAKIMRLGSKSDLKRLFFEVYKSHGIKLGLEELVSLNIVK
jgi:hypothetical protein